MKILEQGAEATIFQKGENLVKERLAKSYRFPELDRKLRKLRTRNEARLLERASSLINVPKVLEVKENSLVLENIKGKRLSRFLEKLKYKEIAKELGREIAKLHDSDIIHGDLTTSNIIYKEKVYFIDFGLGFHSSRVEDKAVDLHVLKEALEAKHPTIASSVWNEIIKNYSSKNKKQILERLKRVESRGRYKAQY